jgi:plasmid stability protein
VVNQTHPTVRQASSKQVTITISGMTPELVAALRCRARGNNRSMSGELREIIRAYFDFPALRDISAQDAAQTPGD